MSRRITKHRSYLYWYVLAVMQQKHEFCMSHRQYRVYWEERHRIRPMGCRSQMIKYPFVPCWSTYLKRKIRHGLGHTSGS